MKKRKKGFKASVGLIFEFVQYFEKLKKARESLQEMGIPISLKYSAFLTEKFSAEFATALAADSGPESANHSQHIELQFSDQNSKFYCKIWFAEYFRMLRKLIFPQGEEAFIRSLARCSDWKPVGGKSGKIFKRHRNHFKPEKNI